MRKIILILLLAGFWRGLGAQAKWEAGFFLGGANYQGDLVETMYPKLNETHPAYGGFVRYLPGQHWRFRLNFLYGELSGDDGNFNNPEFLLHRNFRFSTTLMEGSLLIEWEPFGHKRIAADSSYKNIVSPFLFLGGGVSSFESKPDFSRYPTDGLLDMIRQDLAEASPQSRLVVPLGFGLKIDLSRRAVLGLEVGMRSPFNDYLDGISKAANPDGNDWYTFGGLTFSRRFYIKDFDNDGIADKNDACPKVAGVESAVGCPDADGDGIEDLEDLCPKLAGPLLTSGCPDRDEDGLADRQDACPDLPGPMNTEGCPDVDADGFSDREDRCPKLSGLSIKGGCPLLDTDGDGLIDEEEMCKTFWISGPLEVAGEEIKLKTKIIYYIYLIF